MIELFSIKRFSNFIVDNCILDFFFPKICLICREKILLNENFSTVTDNEIFRTNPFLKSTEYCCYKCKSKLEFAPPKEEIFNNLITNFQNEELAISNAVSLFSRTDEIPIMNLIYKLKYGGFTRIGVEYGKWLGKILAENGLKNYDYIVPIPLHRARKRERGYNQSDYIAQGVNQILNVTVARNLLKKHKSTVSQTSLNSEARRENLSNVFAVNSAYSNVIIDKKILLVDDVLTTGATLNACASVLLTNKVATVDIATLIKA